MTDMLTRAASDSDKAAQEARSHKYHIAIKEGGNVTKPKEFEGVSDDAFGDPVNYRYPMADKAHADNAAARWGDASNREQYSSAEQKIIGDRIAARQRHFGEKPEEKGQRMDNPVIVRADGSHEPFTGTHSHAHSAMGEQGGDETHEHEHSHDGDANHAHSHEDRADIPEIVRSMPSELTLYAPIVRVDQAKREVTVRATSEAVDSYGTVFDYEGSKEAFKNWRGNIREMHDPHKAVGKAVSVQPNDEEKAIDLILRVSKGAEDTWQKVLDGTLSGASVGAKNGKWEKRSINGQEVPVLSRYNLVEVSLVDNPSNPDCSIAIIRADGLATAVIDDATDDETPEVETPTDTRAGKAISAANASKLHDSAMNALKAAKSSADMCGCDSCKAVSMALDPDQDGDIDIVPELDTDHDYAQAGDGLTPAIMKSIQPEITRVAKEAFDAQLGAAMHQLRTVSARLAKIDQPNTAEITRRLEEFAGLKTELTEVRSALAKVQETTESYANRASVGGPVVNTGTMRGGYAPQQPLQPQQIAAQYAPFVELLIKQGIIKGRDEQLQANLLVQKIANGGN